MSSGIASGDVFPDYDLPTTTGPSEGSASCRATIR